MCVKHPDQKGSHPDGQANARNAAFQRRFVVCADRRGRPDMVAALDWAANEQPAMDRHQMQ